MAERRIIFAYGSANCWKEDEEAALALCQPDFIVACNTAGLCLPRLDYWCSLHPSLLPKWLAKRRANSLPDPKGFWTSEYKDCNALKFKSVKAWGGSSGLLTVQVGLALQGTHIICIGIPLKAEFEHYDKKGWWNEASAYRQAWMEHFNDLQAHVRSASGWTALLLGKPTKEWLESDPRTAERRTIQFEATGWRPQKKGGGAGKRIDANAPRAGAVVRN